MVEKLQLTITHITLHKAIGEVGEKKILIEDEATQVP